MLLSSSEVPSFTSHHPAPPSSPSSCNWTSHPGYQDLRSMIHYSIAYFFTSLISSHNYKGMGYFHRNAKILNPDLSLCLHTPQASYSLSFIHLIFMELSLCAKKNSMFVLGRLSTMWGTAYETASKDLIFFSILNSLNELAAEAQLMQRMFSGNFNELWTRIYSLMHPSCLSTVWGSLQLQVIFQHSLELDLLIPGA